MTKEITFKIGMTCNGCKGAITKILSKIDGVENIDANVDTKIVKVTCTDVIENDHLYEPLKKWADKAGKTLELVLDENNNNIV